MKRNRGTLEGLISKKVMENEETEIKGHFKKRETLSDDQAEMLAWMKTQAKEREGNLNPFQVVASLLNGTVDFQEGIFSFEQSELGNKELYEVLEAFSKWGLKNDLQAI